MTDEAKQAIAILQKEILCVSRDCDTSRCEHCDLVIPDREQILQAYDMAIKALEQEPCGDWFDIPSDEMTLEQARQAVRELRKHVMINYLLPKSEDAISRQAAIRIAEQEQVQGYEWQFKELVKLPPVTPQQKMGRWIKMPLIEAGQTYSHECSLCGRRILATDVGLLEFPYCHCGAKMEA